MTLLSQESHGQINSKKIEKRGLTFSSMTDNTHDKTGIFTASCGKAADANLECNPQSGDTICKIEKPVLCFLDIDAPVPQSLEDPQHWSGGVLALSSPVPATQFKSLKTANTYCAATFGEGWRVASFHEGGGWAIKGYGVPAPKGTKFWIDIKNQPKATCWAR